MGGKRNRDAISGQFVDGEHVKANPDTTVTESKRKGSQSEIKVGDDLLVIESPHAFTNEQREFARAAHQAGIKGRTVVILEGGMKLAKQEVAGMADLIAAIRENTEVQRGILAVLMEDAEAEREPEPEEPASPYL